MFNLDIGKDTKTMLLTIGALGLSIISGMVTTAFERDWITREVERKIDGQKLP